MNCASSNMQTLLSPWHFGRTLIIHHTAQFFPTRSLLQLSPRDVFSSLALSCAFCNSSNSRVQTQFVVHCKTNWFVLISPYCEKRLTALRWLLSSVQGTTRTGLGNYDQPSDTYAFKYIFLTAEDSNNCGFQLPWLFADMQIPPSMISPCSTDRC